MTAFGNLKEPLTGDRAAAFARFEAAGLPLKKAEAWRWTDLSPLEALANASPANDRLPDLTRWFIDLDGPRLVFVDGRFVAEASNPGPVTVHGGEAPLGAPHPLGDLAQALATGGYRLELRAEHATSGPVQLVHVSTGGAAHMRNVITLAEDAQASIVETYVDAGSPAWTNIATDIQLARGARLMRTVRQMKNGGLHTDLTRVDVGEAGSYAATTLATGGDSARSESHVRLSGVGAFASVDGVLLGRARQTLDVVNRIEHAAVEGSSRQTWRSVADDQATVSFSGRIEVDRGAQKTDAEQSVKALLLKRTATANAKPELEIFADDVKCAHGATVGELDRNALFYLTSRGIDPVTARALLTEAFLGDALSTIGEDAVREAVTADALAWLKGAA